MLLAMCVNYTPTRNEVWLHQHFGIAAADHGTAPAEVFPAALTPLIRPARAGGFERVSARFGLIPDWARDRSLGRHTYNARAETAAVKPSFRKAWARGQLGVVAMDGFFEPNYESGRAQRWRISRRDGQPMAVACLWDEWRDPATGEREISCSLLTVDAGTHLLLRRFHRPEEEKRSIVPLDAARLARWWSSTPDDRQGCLALPVPDELIAQPVPRLPARRSPAQGPADGAPAAPSEPTQSSLF